MYVVYGFSKVVYRFVLLFSSQKETFGDGTGGWVSGLDQPNPLVKPSSSTFGIYLVMVTNHGHQSVTK